MIKRDKKGQFIKGSKSSGNFKVGHTPVTKGKKGFQIGWLKGKKVDRKKYPKMGAFGKRTKEQKDRMSKSHKGQIPWNKGLGNKTSKNERTRDSKEYKLWRELVFERDNWTCQKCLERGGELNPHHILNFSDYEDIRFDIDNGVTLCRECHYDFHSIYGFINNSSEQIEEYLINSVANET